MAQRLPQPTRTKTREQVAGEYDVNPRTLRRRLKRYNIILPDGHILPKDQLLIYQALGPHVKVLGEDGKYTPFNPDD